MKRAAAFLASVVLLGCGSLPPEEPAASVRVPPPAPVAVTDPRVAELQILVREMVDRMEVMSARMQHLETLIADRGAGSRERIVPPPEVAEPPRVERIQPPSRPARPPLSPAELGQRYREALVLFGQGRLDQARSEFQRVYDAEPLGELADNALFWIAETHFAVGDYAQAIRIYQQIEADYAEQNKAPDALLKMGLAYVRLGDLALAKRTFERLVSRYPYSTPASAAKLEIERIRY